MKRKDLLELALTENKNVSTVVASITKKDAKILEKLRRDLTDDIEKLEDELEERLSSNVPLDKATVEVLYRGIKSKRETDDLYVAFIKEYLTENN